MLDKLTCLKIEISFKIKDIISAGVLRQNERRSARNKIHGYSEHF